MRSYRTTATVPAGQRTAAVSPVPRGRAEDWVTVAAIAAVTAIVMLWTAVLCWAGIHLASAVVHRVF